MSTIMNEQPSLLDPENCSVERSAADYFNTTLKLNDWHGLLARDQVKAILGTFYRDAMTYPYLIAQQTELIERRTNLVSLANSEAAKEVTEGEPHYKQDGASSLNVAPEMKRYIIELKRQGDEKETSSSIEEIQATILSNPQYGTAASWINSLIELLEILNDVEMSSEELDRLLTDLIPSQIKSPASSIDFRRNIGDYKKSITDRSQVSAS